MERTVALAILHDNIKNEKMIQHCLASEAVMKALAFRLNQPVEKWGLAGLLHDLDVEITQANPLTHGPLGAKMLQEKGLDYETCEAIALHNEMASNIPRSSLFHHALAAGETITGLITATALVYPDKKLHSVKVKSITKRMKEKAFAASVKRENIMECEKLGLTLDEFAEIALLAMQEIHDELGL